MKLLVIQALTILLVLFIFLTPLTYAALVSLILVITTVAAMLLLYSAELIAVMLFFCELHVCFILACLTLSWVKHDAQKPLKKQNSTITSQLFVVASATSILVVAVFFDNSTLCDSASHVGVTYFTATAPAAHSIAGVLAYIYVTQYAVEFVLINAFVFFCIIVYVAVFLAFSKNFKNRLYSFANKFLATITRTQSQVKQLLTRVSTRSVANKNKSKRRVTKVK